MVKIIDKNKSRIRRHKRVRSKITGTAECPRLNVFRSSQHIYAQVIDDVKGVTLAAASSTEKGFEGFDEEDDDAQDDSGDADNTFIEDFDGFDSFDEDDGFDDEIDRDGF